MNLRAITASMAVLSAKPDTSVLGVAHSRTSTTITSISARAASAKPPSYALRNVLSGKCTAPITPGCECFIRRAATNVFEYL